MTFGKTSRPLAVAALALFVISILPVPKIKFGEIDHLDETDVGQSKGSHR